MIDLAHVRSGDTSGTPAKDEASRIEPTSIRRESGTCSPTPAKQEAGMARAWPVDPKEDGTHRPDRPATLSRANSSCYNDTSYK